MTERIYVGGRTQNLDKAKKVEEVYDWSDKTLLIAEDEDLNFQYLEVALCKTKINIIRARNGEEAVELARVTPQIDLVLMDIKMPRMNGIEATRSIKSFRNDLVIVAQTAFAMEEDKQNCYAVGMDAFIAKPVRYKLLFDTMSKFLD